MGSYFNTTDTQVVYDDDGRIVAGGDRLEGVERTKQIDQAVKNKQLIEIGNTDVQQIPLQPNEIGSSQTEDESTFDPVNIDKSTDSTSAVSTQTPEVKDNTEATDATEPDPENVSEDVATETPAADQVQSETTTSKKRGK